MANLLTMLQNVADEIGVATPSTIVGNTEPTAVRLYRMAARTGTVLAQKYWHELIKPYTFSTSINEPQYSFPSDYRSLVPDTIWNQTTDQKIYMITPQVWSYEKSTTTAPYHDRFRMMGNDAGPNVGNRLTIHPTPTAVETIYYQYYSSNWAADSGGTEKASLTADADTVLFDDTLFEMGVIWRMLKSIGQPYAEEKADFDQMLEIKLAQSGGMETLHADGHTETLSNIPETGLG